MKSLLLIRCSKRKFKRNDVRAIDLYDGGNFRILRKYYPIETIDVMIISAKYGLISPEDKISYYNVTVKDLSKNEKEKLSKNIMEKLNIFLKDNSIIYDKIFFDLGNDYMSLIKDYDFSSYDIIREDGGIGKKLKKLKQFLENNSKGNIIDFEE